MKTFEETTQCGSLLEPAVPCLRHFAHFGQHESADGRRWGEPNPTPVMRPEISRRERIATAIMATMCGSNYKTEKFYDFPCQASDAVEAADALIKMLDEKSQAIKNQL